MATRAEENARKRRWRSEHPEYRAIAAAANKAWREAHREKRAESIKKWCADNRERIALVQRKWCADNRERIALLRKATSACLTYPGSITADDILAIFVRDNFTCHWCGKTGLAGPDLTIEHLEPKNDPICLTTACFSRNSKRLHRFLSPKLETLDGVSV